MVTLVEQMLARSVHKRLAAASASDRELYQRQIGAESVSRWGLFPRSGVKALAGKSALKA